MGQFSGLKAWAIRAALLGALVTIPAGIIHARTTDPRFLIARATVAFAQAGYAVSVAERRWDARDKSAEVVLLARSPRCGAGVEAIASSIANVVDPAVSATDRDLPLFAFGEWLGAMPPRTRILIEVIRLRLRHAFDFGPTAQTPSQMLVIRDPTACMAVASPDLATIWN